MQTELLDIASGRHLSIEAFDAKLETSMRSIENSQKRSINLASELQSELRAVRREVANTRRLTLDIPHFGKSISFISETDTRLQLGPAERGANSLYGQLESFGAIECTKLVGENSGGAMQVPRLVNIYSRISQRTVCRKLWGILKRSDGDYAVMESLAESDTLEHLLSSGDFLSKLNLVQRLHLAWEISNAVAYLHSVNILLKTLSSQNIHIFGVGSSGGTIRPVLTDLENARLVGTPPHSEWRLLGGF
jgi:serine/threonine protein kinase